MKGYLVSGLSKGQNGLGRFMSRLGPVAEKHGWKVLCRPGSEQKGTLLFALALVVFYLKILFIRHSKVVVLHPQTLRWKVFFRLAASNRLSLYVADNSFFCIRSYNYRDQRWKECLDCLNTLDRCHPSCTPFPVFYGRRRNLAYLHKLKREAKRIGFLAQNDSQAALLKKHFGEEVQVRVVGMVTDEFEVAGREKHPAGGFDVVFHGAVSGAKGAQYAIELARKIPELSFLIPGSADEVETLRGGTPLPENIVVMELSWETGLKMEVERCRIVLCPSLWSAPVEGALVKSILHNGRVGVFDTSFGYQADLPEGLVIRLGSDMDVAAERIRNGLVEEVNEDLIADWLGDLLEKTDLDSIFT